MDTHCGHCGHRNDDESLFCGSCGTKREDLSPFRVGGTFASGRYRADALLGEGGMGTVWRAEDTMLGRTVALKCLAAELTAHPTARRRMEQEARVLARVQSPHVVQVRNVFEEAGVLVLELEYVAGGDLDSRVQSGGMAEREVLSVVVKTLAGLQAIHEAGLIHRDIKPGNVLLDAQGEPKITDLGVAHDPQAMEKTNLGTRLGTPHYMSPEQFRGEGVDVRSDVYSMGVMCYQLLTGELPFAGTTEFDIVAAHIQQAPDLGKLAGSASPQTVAWVARALAKLPSDRWAGAKSMAVSGQAILDGAVVPGLVATPRPAAVTPSPKAPDTPQPVVRPRPEPVRPPPSKVAPDRVAVAPTANKSGGSGLMVGAAALALVVLVGGGVAIATGMSGTEDGDEAASAGAPPTAVAAPALSSAGGVQPAEPTPPAGPPSLIPALRTGDRWRFRYQRQPSDHADLWRIRDHFVDRTVMSVVPIPGGIAVRIKEVGGPSDSEERVFTELYNAEGFGRQTTEGAEISATWSTQEERAAPNTVAPTGSKTIRLKGSSGSYWLHAQLGKIGESTVSGRKRDTYTLTLVGYAVGGRSAGDIDGTPQSCVWNRRTEWLAPGENSVLMLAGSGHKYLTATGARGKMVAVGMNSVEMPSSLTMRGGTVRTHVLGGGLGSLLVAKTWISPSHGEWVAALWHSPLRTTLTVSHMEGSVASNYNVKLETVVTDRSKLKRNHSLLILQRGSACVVGIKGIGPGGRKFTMIRVPDSGRPSILGGDWPQKR